MFVKHPILFTILADKRAVLWQILGRLDQAQVCPYNVGPRELSGELFSPDARACADVENIFGRSDRCKVGLSFQNAPPQIVLEVQAVLFFLFHVSRYLCRPGTTMLTPSFGRRYSARAEDF